MTPPPVLPDSNIALCFERQAGATPDAVAVVADVTSTYHELAVRMQQIDALLRCRGIEAEAPVAVFMSRSAQMIAVLLGILRCGGAYVPLDPSDPPKRNRRILQQSGAKLVLTDGASHAGGKQSLADVGGAIEFVDVEEAEAAAVAAIPPVPAPGGARLAYLLFTSGSSGEPKGVAVEHRSVTNLLGAVGNLIEFTSSDRFLAASTIGFDISVAELFLPLVSGGSLLLRDRNIWLDPVRLAEDVRRHGVTVLQTGPSTWAVILAAVADFPRLRVAISTAEAIPPELANRVAACGDQVWNLYGPTEATVWATAHRLVPDSPPSRESVISAPIGKPIAGTKVLVIGEDGEAVGDGEEGELCLGGPSLARGYYRNEALTRERFIHWGTTSERYYRTGDLVVRGVDGSLLYFGRNDDQLKIRGVRLEPREVESAIRQHAAVAEVAATWFLAADGSRALMAAVVLRPGEVLASVRLHDWLVAHLPAQMIPTRFLFLDALPLSPAGKLNRNELRLAAETVVAAAGGRELTSTEAALSEIWQRLLKLETVAPDDHFFSIGGDSLAAVRMTLEVEAALGVELSVPMLFESPTLEKLALRLERIRGEVDPPSKAGFILPLSVASPGRPLFFNAVDLRMAGRERWRVPCPLYSVSHWAQGVGFLDADSIEDLARRQIVGIRETQPSGPYRIAGYSFGGLVALEIAQQLQDVGEEVEFLFLLDPMQPYRTLDNPEFLGDEPFEFPDRGPWGARLARKLRILVSQPKRLPNYLAMRLVWHFEHSAAAQWLVYKVVHLHGRKPNPVSFWLLPKNRWPAFWYGAQRMARGYTARAFSGRVLAVFPEQGKRVGVWREFINADAETHIVSAAHDGMFTDPAAADWMEVLTRFVEGDLPPVGRRDVIGVAAKALAREDELD